MRVLLSAGMIQDRRSGIGRYVIELAQALVNTQPKVDLFVMGLESDRGHFSFLSDDQWIPITKHYASGLPNLIWHQTHLPRVARAYKADLVHIPSYRRLSTTLHCPQIATIHDCAPFVLRDKYDGLRGFMGRVWAPWVARNHCEQVIGVSKTTGKDLQSSMRIPEDRISAIYNGIDHAKFRPVDMSDQEAVLAKYKLPRRFFFYLSRIEHPGKNHSMLIKAFEKAVSELGDSEIQLVCGGSDWHGAEVIHEQVKRSPIAKQIRMLGFVDDADVPACYTAATATLFPSLYEGFGFPVIESLACGTPVIASDRGSLSEIGASHIIRCDPFDIDSWSDAIKEYAIAPSKCSTKAVEYASSFTWERCAAETVAVYREAL